MCDFDCFNCKEPDCTSSDAPLVDLDEYMQFGLDAGLRHPAEIFTPDKQVVYSDSSVLMGQPDDFLAWLQARDVYPRTPGDVGILRRAYEGGFTGKKLEKALYKVRHREKYMQSKRENKRRKRGKGR